MRRLCATVLIMEAIVIGLAVPVAVQIDHVAARPALLAGAAAVLAAAVLAGLARKNLRVVLAAGSALQVLVIAAGAVVPVMYALGVIFAALWAIGIWLGRRAERPS